MAVSVHCLGEHHLTENLQAFVQHGDDKNSDARSKKLCNLKRQTRLQSITFKNTGRWELTKGMVLR